MMRMVLIATACAGLLAGAPIHADVPDVELTRLADGVYAAVRKEPLGLAVNANSLIVIGDQNVLVVDAQFTRRATLETIAAIRSLTSKPVRFVVNTHWHDDHLAGNQAYRDTFPGVEFILHANTRADLATLGAANRSGTQQGAPPLADRYERLLALGLGIDSTPVSPKERESLSSALGIIRQYLGELSDFRVTTDGPTVQDSYRLNVGRRVVDIRWFGRANTRGDLVVILPSDGIVATGDIVVAPVPFGFGAYPNEWVSVLDSVVALRPRMILPGHGPLLRDLSYVRQVRAMLAEIRDHAAEVERGDSLSAVMRAITLDKYRRAIAGDEKWMNYQLLSPSGRHVSP